ncbi:MAG: hypothetical protein HDT48_05475 [Ruminococcaceae bacterium]|nr:hypothetical protein [Oscillospiraceae bacterium]
MNAIKIEDTHVVIEKDFIKKIIKSLVLAVIAIAFIIYANTFWFCVSFEKSSGAVLRNIMVVLFCCIIVMCAGKTVENFICLKKAVRNLLYLGLSLVVGYRFFYIAYSSMADASRIESTGLDFPENLILLGTVHLILTALIFIITLLFNTLNDKMKRKKQSNGSCERGEKLHA